MIRRRMTRGQFLAVVRDLPTPATKGDKQHPAAAYPPGESACTLQAGRNEPCPCGSGKKYKHCHRDQDSAQPS